MTDPVESFLNEQKNILKIVDEILDAWTGDGCYQVPTLLLNLASKLSWNADQMRRNDPIVRLYLKDHPLWFITRGAKGGIMRRAEHDKREAAKLAKEKAKAEIKAQLLEKSAALTASVSATTETVSDDETAETTETLDTE